MVTYVICERSQKSRGSSAGRFGGPDKYVCVQVLPDGVAPLRVLNASVAECRGITLIRTGEGYSKNDGDRSSLSLARREAVAECRRLGAMPNQILQEGSWDYLRKYRPDDQSLMARDKYFRDRGYPIPS